MNVGTIPRRFSAAILRLALALGLMLGTSLTAYAEDNNVASITDGNGGVTLYTSIDSAIGTWWSMDGGTKLTLLADVETTGSINLNGGTVDSPKVFDLNGHGILNTGNSTDGSPVLFVMNNTFIEIQDSNYTTTHYVSLDSTGRAIGVSDSPSDGAVEVLGGYISGGFNGDASNGGGIWIQPGSVVTMTGGTILGNKAGNGGGVFVTESSSFIMTGGTIKNNAAASGGGIYCLGSFTNSGGSVTGNSPNEVSHAHSYTYSASGATITATCSVTNCPLTDSKATLTINVPSLTTYGGTGSAEATIDGSIDGVTNPTVIYRKGTEELDAAPTGAGTYTASITLGEGDDAATAIVEYTIAKADPIANAPTSLMATYGQTLADVSLEDVNPEGNTPGAWAWVDSTQSVGNVVSPAAAFKANFTPEDTANYNSANGVDVAVTVGKADSPATVVGTARVTKGGKTVDLAGNVTLNGATGDVSYAISGETNGCSLDGSVLTSGNTPGSVTVNVTVAEDGNYNALAATPITVTIEDKQAQTITAADVEATYGDTGKKVEASTDGGGQLSYVVKSGDAVTVDESTGALTIAKAGSAVVTVTAAETDDYALATKDVTVSVATKDLTITAGSASKPHDGTALTCEDFTADGLAEGDSVVSVTFTGSQTEVGTCANVASGATVNNASGDDVTASYAIAYVDGELEVTEADLSEAEVTLSKTSYVYDGMAKTPSVTVTLGGRELVAGTDYTVSYKNNTKVGIATVIVTGRGSYTGSAEATFSIVPGKVCGLSTVGCPALGAIEASWDKVAGATTYELSWRVAGGKWSTKAVKSTCIAVLGLKKGACYEVRVRAKAGSGVGEWSDSSLRYLKTASCVKVQSGPSKGSVKVSWAKDKDATGGFEVLAYEKIGGKVVATKTVSAGSTSATLTGLKSGKTYYVRVRPMAEKSGSAYTGVLSDYRVAKAK